MKLKYLIYLELSLLVIIGAFLWTFSYESKPFQYDFISWDAIKGGVGSENLSELDSFFNEERPQAPKDDNRDDLAKAKASQEILSQVEYVFSVFPVLKSKEHSVDTPQNRNYIYRIVASNDDVDDWFLRVSDIAPSSIIIKKTRFGVDLYDFAQSPGGLGFSRPALPFSTPISSVSPGENTLYVLSRHHPQQRSFSIHSKDEVSFLESLHAFSQYFILILAFQAMIIMILSYRYLKNSFFLYAALVLLTQLFMSFYMNPHFMHHLNHDLRALSYDYFFFVSLLPGVSIVAVAWKAGGNSFLQTIAMRIFAFAAVVYGLLHPFMEREQIIITGTLLSFLSVPLSLWMLSKTVKDGPRGGVARIKRFLKAGALDVSPKRIIILTSLFQVTIFLLAFYCFTRGVSSGEFLRGALSLNILLWIVSFSVYGVTSMRDRILERESLAKRLAFTTKESLVAERKMKAKFLQDLVSLSASLRDRINSPVSVIELHLEEMVDEYKIKNDDIEGFKKALQNIKTASSSLCQLGRAGDKNVQQLVGLVEQLREQYGGANKELDVVRKSQEESQEKTA